VIRSIHKRLDEIHRDRSDLTFSIEWVPGHIDILGNEKAGEAAKKVAMKKLTRIVPIRKLKYTPVMKKSKAK